MKELLWTLLGISIFTAAFCGIFAFRSTFVAPPSPVATDRDARLTPVSNTQTIPTSPQSQNTSTPTTPLTPSPGSLVIPTANASTPANTDTNIPSPTPVTNNKHILVTLKTQTLQYFEGDTLVGEFKISSGLRGTPTPPGDYTILAKKPTVNYFGENYRFPNTKWNLMFKAHSPLNYYIHGAYWHNNFGKPMSHGCVNVSYANMEPLYNWADVGTPVTIQ